MTYLGQSPQPRPRRALPTALAVAAAGMAFLLIVMCGGFAVVGAITGGPARHVALQSADGHTPASVPPAQPPSPTAPASPSPAAIARSTAPAATTAPAPPPPAAPPPATKAAATCGAPANPYGFTFCGGKRIYPADLPGDVCAYFDCIANFSNGVGYMEQCQDGTYSMSGGRQGACSHHGGEKRPVYRP